MATGRKVNFSSVQASAKGKGFDSVIFNAEDIALTGADIHNITQGKCSVYPYEELAKFNTIDQVLSKDGSAMILYQLTQNYGHWVTIFKVDDKTLEYFDSYGLPVDGELKFSKEHLRRHNGKIVPHLTALIKQSNHGYKVIYNDIALQKLRENEATCGRFAGLRVRLKNIPLKRFQELCIKNKAYDPSFWVSALTLGYAGFDRFDKV
jgi:hypothetical protein